MNKYSLFFRTIVFLKFIQIFYQVFYRIKFFFIPYFKYSSKYNKKINLNWKNQYYSFNSFRKFNSFEFLNIHYDFKSKINWNLLKFGKLWCYNLNYFDFLNQRQITKNQGLKLIRIYINQYSSVIVGKEPYPTSLRIINFIKFISKHNIDDEIITSFIRENSERLLNNLEYHLMGNHLLENGFALWFSAHLFDDNHYYLTSKKIITKQLTEQILNDGAHFELSPMYHSILLTRLLDCIKLSTINGVKNSHDLDFMKNKAALMNSWLNKVIYNSGSLPMLNDSSNNIAQPPKQIFNYLKKIDIEDLSIPLGDSGYRKIHNKFFEMLIDVGNIGPDYQPGHSHADTFSFEICICDSPVFVDTGISTYEINDIRNYERSTKAHNTVVINNCSSSEMWKGFRVADRAKIIKIEENSNKIKASHDGYKKFGVIHERTWKWKDNKITIIDNLVGNNKNNNLAYYHLYPDTLITELNNGFVLNNKHEINFTNHSYFRLIDYGFSMGFNLQKPAKCIEVNFDENLETNIKI